MTSCASVTTCLMLGEQRPVQSDVCRFSQMLQKHLTFTFGEKDVLRFEF